jgi:hypothetical protein
MITGMMMLLLTVRQSGQSALDGIARETLTDVYSPCIKATPYQRNSRERDKKRRTDSWTKKPIRTYSNGW